MVFIFCKKVPLLPDFFNHFMKKYFLTILAIAVLFPQIGFSQSNIEIQEKKLLETILVKLRDSHYRLAKINDEFSKTVFNQYINSLDKDHHFFLESDITEFKKLETKIDDQIINNDLSFFEMTYDRIIKRMKEAKVLYTDISKTANNYSIDESVNIHFGDDKFPRNHSELKNRWRLQMKYLVLDTLTKRKAKYPQYASKKTFDELENEARKNIFQKFNNNCYNVEHLDREHFFTLYINAIVNIFDPHSKYIRPYDKNEAEMETGGKLADVGLSLKLSNNFITIKEIIYGGPASKNKNIEAEDVILKMAEGDSKPVDVIGFSLSKFMSLMKGNIGTTISLTIKKQDGSIQNVSLKRDIIEFKDSFVKSSIVEKNGAKFGIIDLPKFYKDFDDKNNRDAAKEVKNELELLKNEGVEGILIDLRNNGGGAVASAIEITRLFIDQGPVVQIKSANGAKEVLSDADTKTQWDGPLVVLLNYDSASASEIFAAAIQDYKRGIIMGSKQSFGKGTVQKSSDIDLLHPNGTRENHGVLQTTIKKIYRINGASTQLEGVSSDIVMPDKFSYVGHGERKKENVLPWDKISPVPFKPSINNFESIIAASKLRIAKSPYFQLIDMYAQFLNKKKEDYIVNLNVVKYKVEHNRKTEELNNFNEINNYENNLIFKSTSKELSLIKNTPSLDLKRKEWHQNLSTDIYIDEAINVLSDMKSDTLLPKTAVLNLQK